LLPPLVILATLATIIASQAVISGVFSLTRQAMQLGYIPRMRVVYTSASRMGQIYIPQINWLLMLCTLGLVLGFQRSSKLAAAYGVAVTTTMVITTGLFYLVARNLWRWSWPKAALLTTLFLLVDLAFFSANIIKVAHGAWLPLLIGAMAFILLTTWRRGRAALAAKLYSNAMRLEEFVDKIVSTQRNRTPGNAVFMAGLSENTPPALLHNFEHNKTIHQRVVIMTILTREAPTVPKAERLQVRDLGRGFYRVVASFGYMEQPSVPLVFELLSEQGLRLAMSRTSFFVGRERLLPDRTPMMPLWREKIFSFMSRNALGATTYFGIPSDRVIEVGARVEI
jgi:KUP system potassium uptake protein